MDLKSLLNQALNSDLLKQGSEALNKQTQNLKNNTNASQLKTLGAGALGGGIIGMLMGSKKRKDGQEAWQECAQNWWRRGLRRVGL